MFYFVPRIVNTQSELPARLRVMVSDNKLPFNVPLPDQLSLRDDCSGMDTLVPETSPCSENTVLGLPN
ncbi:MAG: hypothetical protein JNJ57_04600 [Saprospiraceae bacterium]|nr:hypothetical protein [Saprospiraceae bacterium]